MEYFDVSNLARCDLAGIHHSISKHNESAADRQIARFYDVFQLLAKNEELGERYVDVPNENLRMFVVDKYAVFYRIRPRGGIEVARVIHGSRNISSTMF